MSLVVLGLAGELRPQGIAVNALWPRTTIATAAIQNLLGGERRDAHVAHARNHGRRRLPDLPEAGPSFTGHFLIDDSFLAGEGVTDFEQYRVDPGSRARANLLRPGLSAAAAGRHRQRKPMGMIEAQRSEPTCPGSLDRSMTTLLITHPACLDHFNAARPSGAAGPAARDRRAPSSTRTLPGSSRAIRRRTATLESIALCHPMEYVDGDPRSDAARRPGPARRRHLDVAGQLRGGAARGRRRDLRGRRGDGRQGRQRLRRHAPARPSRRDRAADGLLPVQQRRDRRPPCAEEARRRARRHRRFRRASRQRHAGDLLGRPDRDVLLDAPDAALSRHRRGLRARRPRQHRQRAAARRRRRRAASARRSKPSILPRLR